MCSQRVLTLHHENPIQIHSTLFVDSRYIPLQIVTVSALHVESSDLSTTPRFCDSTCFVFRRPDLWWF